MPTYQYACTACSEELEAVQSFSDPALTQCPACGGRLRKKFSAVGVVFKGSGFYKNDSRPAAKSGDGASKDGASGGDGAGKSSEKGGDASGSKGGDKAAAPAASSGSSSSGSSSSGSSSSGSSSSGSSSSGSSSGRSSSGAKTPAAKGA